MDLKNLKSSNTSSAKRGSWAGGQYRTAPFFALLQGFFSHEQELARSLSNYYAECGIELIPFLRDQKDWDQLIDVLEEFARLAPAGSPLKVQVLKDMEALLNE